MSCWGIYTYCRSAGLPYTHLRWPSNSLCPLSLLTGGAIIITCFFIGSRLF